MNFDPTILKYYYGHDLTKFTNEQIEFAYHYFEDHPKKSKISKKIWIEIMNEFNRRISNRFPKKIDWSDR